MTLVKRLPGVSAWLGLGLLLAFLPHGALGLITGRVQGTVYRADGSVATGTLLLSWPAFTTSADEAVASGHKTVRIGDDGWVAVSLAPNAGASPDGTYYTAVYHLNDGSTSTEYWVVPSSAAVGLASVRATVMPVSKAVQTVTRQYVDTSIAGVTTGFLHASGGTMSGSLLLAGDPAVDYQAATKRYVDQASTSAAVAKTGGTMTGALNVPMVNGKAFAGVSTIQQAITAAGATGSVEIPASYTGIDAFTNPNGIPIRDISIAVPQDTRSVKEFGARCLGYMALNGTITSGSSILVVTGGTPTSALVGRYMVVQVTGSSVSLPSVYMPTVTSIIDPTHVQLSSVAPYTGLFTYFFWQDDYPGVQAAMAWSVNNLAHLVTSVYDAPKGLSFPAGQCFLSQPVLYSCQSMAGQGETISSVFTAPASDAFVSPDPAVTPSYFCHDNAHIHDMTVFVDASVEATKQPGWLAKKRWAGQNMAWANNPTGPYWSVPVTLSAGHTIGGTTLSITPTPTLNRSWFDVGFAQMGSVKIGTNVCSYNGVTVNVLNNVVCGTQGTADAIAATGASVIPVNPFLYTDVVDYFPSWQIGNGAFIFESADGTDMARMPSKLTMDHVMIFPSNRSTSNLARSTVAIYSTRPPYDAQFTRNHIETTFGFIFPYPPVNQDAYTAGAPVMDAAKFTDNIEKSSIPFLAMNGSDVKLSGNSWYISQNGSPDYRVYPHGLIWNTGYRAFVENHYIEVNSGNDPGGVFPPAGSYPDPWGEISGQNGGSYISADISGAGYGHSIGTMLIESSFNKGINTHIGEATITGAGNDFANGGAFNDVGMQNKSDFVAQFGNKSIYATPARANPIYNTVTTDALRGGNVGADAYRSLDDLFLTPENMVNTQGIQSLGTTSVADTTAPITGRYVPTTGGIPGFRINGITETWRVGADFPAGKGTFYLMGRAQANSVMALRFGPNTSAFALGYCTWTANVWKACSVRYDTTGATGALITIDTYDSSRSGTIALNPVTELDVAWMAAVPDMGTLAAANASIGTATVDTIVVGNLTATRQTGTAVGTALISTMTDSSTGTIYLSSRCNYATQVFSQPEYGFPGMALFGAEVISWSASSCSGGGYPALSGLVRGLFGTVPNAHGMWEGVTTVPYSLIVNNTLAELCTTTGCNFGIDAPSYPLSFGGVYGGEANGKWHTSQLISHAATGTPPILVTSTTPVANLTLASPSQVPNLPATQITGLAAVAVSGSYASLANKPVAGADFVAPDGSITGNASTASSLATTPTLCSTGQAATGILANGNSTGCATYAPMAAPSFTTQATAPKFIGVISSETDISFSATPTFPATANLIYMSLTGNVTSSTLAPGANGQSMTFVLCQDATGSHTFVWPANVRGGMTLGATASKCSSQMFTYVNALPSWVAATSGTTGE